MTLTIVLAVLYVGVAITFYAMGTAYAKELGVTPKRSLLARLAMTALWPIGLAASLGSVVGKWLAKR